METLRRATIYASRDQRVARELLSRLMARAQEAEARGRPDTLASFDAGYLVETYKQAVPELKNEIGAANTGSITDLVRGLDGYAWIQKAIGLRGKDAEMEFAAAIITRRGRAPNDHLLKAASGATDGSLLARNLVRHFEYRGKTIAELKANAGAAKN